MAAPNPFHERWGIVPGSSEGAAAPSASSDVSFVQPRKKGARPVAQSDFYARWGIEPGSAARDTAAPAAPEKPAEPAPKKKGLFRTYVAPTAPAQFVRGAAEGVVNFPKDMATLAWQLRPSNIANFVTSVVKDPTPALKAGEAVITGARHVAQDPSLALRYGRGVTEATVTALANAMRSNPGRTAGRAAAELILAFKPGLIVNPVLRGSKVFARQGGIERVIEEAQDIAHVGSAATESDLARFQRQLEETRRAMPKAPGRLEVKRKPGMTQAAQEQAPISQPAKVAAVQPVEPPAVAAQPVPVAIPARPAVLTTARPAKPVQVPVAEPVAKALPVSIPPAVKAPLPVKPVAEASVPKSMRAERAMDELLTRLEATGLSREKAAAVVNRGARAVQDRLLKARPAAPRPVSGEAPVRAVVPEAPARAESSQVAQTAPLARRGALQPEILKTADEIYGAKSDEEIARLYQDLTADFTPKSREEMIAALDKRYDKVSRAKPAVPPVHGPVEPGKPVGIKIPLPTRAVPEAAALGQEPVISAARPRGRPSLKPVDELAANKAALMRKAAERRAAREALSAKPAITPITEGVPERIPGSGVRLAPVESTAIESMGYDAAAKEFAVKYRGREGTKVWTGVEQETADAIAAAPSKGKAISSMLRGSVEHTMAQGDQAIKRLADDVEGLIAQGIEEKDIVKGITSRSTKAGVKPREFIAKVRAERGIPEDPEQYVQWSKAYRAAKREAVASAPAKVITPADELVLRRAAKQEPIAGSAVPDGGPDFATDLPEIGGGAAKIPRVQVWFDNLLEATNKIRPGTDQFLKRADDAGESMFAKIALKLRDIRWHGVADSEKRALYESLFHGAPAANARVSEADAIVRQMNHMRPVALEKDLVRTKGFIDWWKVGKMDERAMARSLAAANGFGLHESLRHATAIKSMLRSEKPLNSIVRYMTEKGVTPSYEMLTDLRRSIPAYLQKASSDIAFRDVIPNERAFLQMMSQGDHPDFGLWKEVYDRWRGKDYVTHSQIRQRDMARFLNASSAALLLSPVTGLKQLSQVVPMAAQTGVRDMAVGLGRALTPTGRYEAQAAGAAMIDLRQLIGMELGTLERVGWQGIAADKATQAAGVVVKVTGIQALDNFMRSVAFLAKKNEYTRLVNAAAHGNRGAVRRLMSEGMDIFDPITMRIKSGVSPSYEVELGAKSFADRANLRTDLLRVPIKFTEPGWPQFMRGLNMFSIQTTKMLWTDFLKPVLSPRALGFMKWSEAAGRMGKMAGYTTLVGSLMADTEAFMLGRKPKDHDTAGRLATAWTMLGTLGAMDLMANGLIDEQGKLVESGKVPALLAKNWASMIDRYAMGSGLNLVRELPASLQSKKRAARLVPIIGPWVKEYVVNNSDD